MLSLRVAETVALTPRVRALRLVSTDGGALPGYAPGAHIQIEIPGTPASETSATSARESQAVQATQHPTVQRQPLPQWRSYSLLNFDPACSAAAQVDEYRLGVRLEDESLGGSRFMHALAVGDTLRARAPVNHFPLAAPLPVLLIAGGIGITPIASMAARLVAEGRDFALHYSARSAAQMPFVAELRALAGARLVLHADDDPSRFAPDALLGQATVGQPIYVCGPPGMIDATLAAARKLGWRESELHCERFAEVAPQAGDDASAAFEVELKSSGKVITVAAGQSLLDALLDAGADVMYDCRSGYCGLCTVNVCNGQIEHRDTYLSDADKAGGRLMQTCVSRAKAAQTGQAGQTGRLVLDL